MKNKFAHLGRVLTREEAKLIVGGSNFDLSSETGSCDVKCTEDSDCGRTCSWCNIVDGDRVGGCQAF
ncbi:MAG: hypothetical protein JST07_02860 [Bacteroidetes bacterium]|nr:hypothetical protein [Bacteroidota bacterium]